MEKHLESFLEGREKVGSFKGRGLGMYGVVVRGGGGLRLEGGGVQNSPVNKSLRTAEKGRCGRNGKKVRELCFH